jgi:hypothetical protein
VTVVNRRYLCPNSRTAKCEDLRIQVCIRRLRWDVLRPLKIAVIFVAEPCTIIKYRGQATT